MALPRPQIAHSSKVRALLFELASTRALLIVCATGCYVLADNASTQNYLGGFVGVLFSVFGLYGAVLGILRIKDARRNATPHISTGSTR